MPDVAIRIPLWYAVAFGAHRGKTRGLALRSVSYCNALK